MTDLPRRPIRPLPPPPGSFEHTVARACSRRRRALVGASSAGLAAVAVVAIVGATSLGHVGAQRDVRPVVPVVSTPPPASAPPSSASPTPAPTSAPPTPASAAPSSVSPSTTAPVVVSPPVSSPPPVVVVSSPPPSAPPTYRGRLVDAAHHPLKGYYLYWDSPGLITAQTPNELSVDQPAATTRADGTFDVDCGTVINPALAISAVQIPSDAHSNLITPNDNGLENEVNVTYTGATAILPLVDVRHACAPGAPRQTTIFRPYATVTGTLSIDGKPYSAADAFRRATAQPGDPGSDLTQGAAFNTPNGQNIADDIFPEPGTGVFTLRGVAPGDIVFLVAHSPSVKVPLVDGQLVRVAVAITTGSLPTGADATISVTVVP